MKNILTLILALATFAAINAGNLQSYTIDAQPELAGWPYPIPPNDPPDNPGNPQNA